MKHKILAITLSVVTIVLFVVWAIVPSIVGLPSGGGRIDDSEVVNGTALQRGAAIASWLGFPLTVFAGMGAWDQSLTSSPPSRTGFPRAISDEGISR